MVSRKQNTTKQTIKDANGEEIAMPNMMMMNIFMPIMSGFISYSVPQSMGLYWFINSFIQIIIQFVSEKIVEKKDNKDSKVLDPIDPIKDDNETDEVIKDEKAANSSKSKKNKKSKKKK
jgi:membrane protein insertase Oxa1/YidC/SpoIIIJ